MVFQKIHLHWLQVLRNYVSDFKCYLKSGSTSDMTHRLLLVLIALFHSGKQLQVIFGMARSSLRPLIFRQPLIFVKFMKRNYLALNLSRTLRADLLRDHYRLLEHAFGRDTISRLPDPGIVLWQRQCTTYGHEIRLQFSDDPYHEGELTLCYRISGDVIYWLGFSLMRGCRFDLDVDTAAFVTRVQLWATYDLVKKAAKDADDMFPVYALLAALEGIADALDLDGIIGVDARSQASSRENKYAAERAYDDLFQAIGGVRVADEPGLCQAPSLDNPISSFFWLPIGRKDTLPVEAKKSHRARARKRRQFRHSVREATVGAVQQIVSSRFSPRPDVGAARWRTADMVQTGSAPPIAE